MSTKTGTTRKAGKIKAKPTPASKATAGDVAPEPRNKIEAIMQFAMVLMTEKQRTKFFAFFEEIDKKEFPNDKKSYTDLLPLPLEFVDTTMETADEVMTAALEKLQAPEDVKELAKGMYWLFCYTYTAAHTKPKGADQLHELGADGAMKVIKSIGNLGGIFYAKGGSTQPRKHALVKITPV